MLVIPVKYPEVYQSGRFASKPVDSSDLAETLVMGQTSLESFLIEELIVLNSEEWLDFHEDYNKDRSYLAGKGGIGHSTTNAYRKCIAVFKGVVEDGELKRINKDSFTIVDPQGYGNVQYATVSEDYKEGQKYRWKLLMEDIAFELSCYLIEEEPKKVKRNQRKRLSQLAL